MSSEAWEYIPDVEFSTRVWKTIAISSKYAVEANTRLCSVCTQLDLVSLCSIDDSLEAVRLRSADCDFCKLMVSTWDQANSPRNNETKSIDSDAQGRISFDPHWAEVIGKHQDGSKMEGRMNIGWLINKSSLALSICTLPARGESVGSTYARDISHLILRSPRPLISKNQCWTAKIT